MIQKTVVFAAVFLFMKKIEKNMLKIIINTCNFFQNAIKYI